MAARLNIISGMRNTDFYNGNIPNSLDVSGGNVAKGAAAQLDGTQEMSGAGSLPALWWLGILIGLVALRLAYEYS